MNSLPVIPRGIVSPSSVTGEKEKSLKIFFLGKSVVHGMGQIEQTIFIQTAWKGIESGEERDKREMGKRMGKTEKKIGT